MEYGCPVCNGFFSIGEICPFCKGLMEDAGRIEDYYAPYSPYEEQDKIPELKEADKSCIHLFTCLNCNSEKEVMIPYEIM